MTKEGKIKKWHQTPWGYITYLVILTFPLAEIALRLTDHKPYSQSEYQISSSPSNCLKPDSIYGFHLAEGGFDIRINKGHHYKATHKNGKRNWLDTFAGNAKKIFLMGCSFTYGMGVNDNETFTSILQGQDTLVNIANFGVPGYGTVQSILQLENEILNGNIPDLVVLNFSKLHFDRNALTPKYRKDLTIGYARSSDLSSEKMHVAKFPFLKKSDNSTFSWCAWDELYTNWPGRETFALVHYFNSIKDKNSISYDESIRISEALFERLNHLCKKNKIQLKICFLDMGPSINQMESFCRKQDISFKNVGLSHTSKEETNLPFDSHPNAIGHQKIANIIQPWIEELKGQN